MHPATRFEVPRDRVPESTRSAVKPARSARSRGRLVAAWTATRTLRGFMAGLLIGASAWVPVFTADAAGGAASSPVGLLAALGMFAGGLVVRMESVPRLRIAAVLCGLMPKFVRERGSRAGFPCCGNC